MKRICVFCGANNGAKSNYLETAQEIGRAIVERGWGVVYGGGRTGLMGAVADAALAAGGEVVGVIPEALVAKEVAHQGVTELRVVRSMHERKAMMEQLSDAIIALPGGLGTFEEFFEIVTWAQLGIHNKPCGLLNVEGYYDDLLAMLNKAVAERFVRGNHRALVVDERDPEKLLDRIADYAPPKLENLWIDREET